MITPQASVPDQYFERLYEGGQDPWGFATSAYEQDKYAATLAAVGPGTFSNAWEIGCAIGVFTRLLATRCHCLLAVDVAPSALEQARQRCADLGQVQFARMRIPGEWPETRFDLIVLSEVLYYLCPEELTVAAAKAAASLAPGGKIVLVHWTGETGTPRTGDAAAEHFIAAAGLDQTICDRHSFYRLDLLWK